eukprot:6214789-Pleurochrysis_carterae.AAC.3
MPCCPVRIRVAVHCRVRAHLVAQAYIAMVIQVSEDALCRKKELGRRTAHGAAEHADGVRDVRASLRGAIQKSAYQRLVRAKQVRIRGGVGLCGQGGVDEFGKVIGGGGVCATRGGRHPVGHEGIHEMPDVGGLGEGNMLVTPNDVDVEQIGYWSFVLHVPSISEGVGEVCVEGVRGVVGVEDEQVVHVASDNELLASFTKSEDTRVRGRLNEPEMEKPRE